jgi:hypothetical protein
MDIWFVCLPLFISSYPFYDSCILQGVIFDNIVLLFCYQTSCPFLDHSDTIPVLWQCPDTASKRALARAPLMHTLALMVIEILGVPGLSTLVHVGYQILVVNIDIVLLYLRCEQKR